MFPVMDAHQASDVKVVEAIEWCGHEEGLIDGTFQRVPRYEKVWRDALREHGVQPYAASV